MENNEDNPLLRKPGASLHVPPGGMPSVPVPSSEIYEAMGRENIFRMCRDFYAELEKSEIRGMFPPDMPEASEKIAAFFVWRLGGPPLYQQRHGEPMLRKRHFPFVIDAKAREVWLAAFKKTLEGAQSKYGLPEKHLPGFIAFLEGLSAWMVNAE